MSEPAIRPGALVDLEALARIYDHYIVHTPTTFDLEPLGAEGRRPWLESFETTGRHRLFVAECGDGVVGYACSHSFRPKGAYATSVETSVYLDPGWTGHRLGARLYAALFDALAVEDVHRAYAGITLPNPASIALHERFGFAQAGVFQQVGRKLDRYWDVAWYEKRLR